MSTARSFRETRALVSTRHTRQHRARDSSTGEPTRIDLRSTRAQIAARSAKPGDVPPSRVFLRFERNVVRPAFRDPKTKGYTSSVPPLLSDFVAMKNRSNLPTLFGRATAILNEHHTSLVVLQRLERECALLASDGAPARYGVPFAYAMKCWRVELAAQFAAEESDDYFATMVAEIPALAGLVQQLKREHRIILLSVDTLLALGESLPPSELKRYISSLAQHLRDHEAAERNLVREFLAHDEPPSEALAADDEYADTPPQSSDSRDFSSDDEDTDTPPRSSDSRELASDLNWRRHAR